MDGDSGHLRRFHRQDCRNLYPDAGAPYVNPDGFRFKIYRKSIFTGIGKALGMQDVDIGDEEFDREFVVHAQ